VNRALARILVLGLALAATSAPAAAPAPGAVIPLIPYEKFTLDNGLTVVVHTDRKAPIVAVNVWYHVGSKNEKPGKTGFAHLFEHLMFQGTENFNDEYFKPFEQVGATSMNGTTSFDRTNYFQNVPTTALDMALWMESDRMGHLLGVIDQARLDEQRGVVQNEKRQNENRPNGRVFETVFRASFPVGHPYHSLPIGSMEDLNAASLDDVKDWFRTYYGAANAVLVLAGDIDAATARDKAQEYFGDIPPGPALTRPGTWIAARTDSRRDVMYDQVAQVRLQKSWNTPPDGTTDADLLSLVGEILGGGKTSRLYERLVYREQIADSASAGLSPLEIAGLFSLSANVKNCSVSSTRARPGQRSSGHARPCEPDSCAASNALADSAARPTCSLRAKCSKAIRPATSDRSPSSTRRPHGNCGTWRGAGSRGAITLSRSVPMRRIAPRRLEPRIEPGACRSPQAFRMSPSPTCSAGTYATACRW
jgi:zinc protease